MAYTIVRTSTVFGNQKTAILDVSADAAESNIQVGLGRIVGISYCPISMNSSNIHIAVNSNSTGLASPGVVGVSGCTSGDRFFITVYGA
jgi:hypothetical protein